MFVPAAAGFLTGALLATGVVWRRRAAGLPVLTRAAGARVGDLICRLEIGAVLYDADGRVVDANGAYARFAGQDDRTGVVGRRVHECLDPAEHERFDAFLKGSPAGPQGPHEIVYSLRDGTRRIIELQYENFMWRRQKRIIAVCRDVTLQRSDAAQTRLLKKALDSSREGISISRLEDRDARLVYVNSAFGRLFGYSAEEACAQGPRALFDETPGAQAELDKILFELSRGREIEHRHLARRKDGSTFLRQISITPFTDSLSNARYAVSIHNDVTESAALSQRLELKRRAIHASQNGIAIVHLRNGQPVVLFANKAMSVITGYGSADIQGSSPDLFLDSRAFIGRGWTFADVAAGPKSIHVTGENRRKDGTRYWSEIFIDPVADDGGALTHFIVMVNDVTARKKAEERLNLSQRVEALGQLTGGVAHDFNNLLTVIIGNIRLMQQPGADPEARTRRLKLALEAAERGTRFTRRLLAFARRQALHNEVISVNRMIGDLVPMLGRTLGETIDVETALDPLTPNCNVDRAQLESALMNLVINARDAMPKGGRLVITTTEKLVRGSCPLPLKPGRYAQITVTDTGFGMPPEVRERAFEPFFTTKDVGKGTGLGLSTVFGFVRQSGGYTHLYSEVGRGTSVKIFLPGTRELVLDDVEGADAFTLARGHGQQILVVEDDELVRATAVSLLAEAGYRPLPARNAAEALTILETNGDIALVFADVVMPGGISGIDLVRTVRKVSPQVPILLASGYPHEALRGHDHIGDHPHFLPKPYEPNDLLMKIGELLAAAAETDAQEDPGRRYAGEREATNNIRATGGISS